MFAFLKTKLLALLVSLNLSRGFYRAVRAILSSSVDESILKSAFCMQKINEREILAAKLKT